jgi:hypothetical protein
VNKPEDTAGLTLGLQPVQTLLTACSLLPQILHSREDVKAEPSQVTNFQKWWESIRITSKTQSLQQLSISCLSANTHCCITDRALQYNTHLQSAGQATRIAPDIQPFKTKTKQHQCDY